MDNLNDYTNYKFETDLTHLEIIENVCSDIKNIIDQGNKKILLDFQNVKAINSSAIGKLLFLNNLLEQNEGVMKFQNVNDSLKSLFTTLLLDKAFEILE